MNIGDIIQFDSTDLPVTMQAAVVNITDDEVELLSSLLVPFRHGGTFKREGLSNIVVVHPAEEAVKLETRGKFTLGQLIRSTRPAAGVDGASGNIIAAFDGVVLCIPNPAVDEKPYLFGGIAYFEAIA